MVVVKMLLERHAVTGNDCLVIEMRGVWEIDIDLQFVDRLDQPHGLIWCYAVM